MKLTMMVTMIATTALALVSTRAAFSHQVPKTFGVYQTDPTTIVDTVARITASQLISGTMTPTSPLKLSEVYRRHGAVPRQPAPVTSAGCGRIIATSTRQKGRP